MKCVCRSSMCAMQVEKRQLANPKKAGEEPYKPLAPVLENSTGWGGFVAVSTNLRYQLVNGIEERGLVSSLPVYKQQPMSLVRGTTICWKMVPQRFKELSS